LGATVEHLLVDRTLKDDDAAPTASTLAMLIPAAVDERRY
jgi:hypothetical protein